MGFLESSELHSSSAGVETLLLLVLGGGGGDRAQVLPRAGGQAGAEAGDQLQHPGRRHRDQGRGQEGGHRARRPHDLPRHQEEGRYSSAGSGRSFQ